MKSLVRQVERVIMSRPRYQDIRSSEIPELKRENDVRIRVITGTVEGLSGPVTDIAADPIPAQTSFIQPVERGHTAFAYVFEGSARFAGGDHENGPTVSHPWLVLLSDGNSVEVITAAESVRFLLVSGKPLHELIARYGPFVMNTKEEIEETLLELREGTFVTT